MSEMGARPHLSIFGGPPLYRAQEVGDREGEVLARVHHPTLAGHQLPGDANVSRPLRSTDLVVPSS